MFEHNVGVFANKRTNIATQAAPLFFIVRAIFIEELVVGSFAIDDCFATHFTQDLCLVW